NGEAVRDTALHVRGTAAYRIVRRRDSGLRRCFIEESCSTNVIRVDVLADLQRRVMYVVCGDDRTFEQFTLNAQVELFRVGRAVGRSVDTRVEGVADETGVIH